MLHESQSQLQQSSNLWAWNVSRFSTCNAFGTHVQLLSHALRIHPDCSSLYFVYESNLENSLINSVTIRRNAGEVRKSFLKFKFVPCCTLLYHSKCVLQKYTLNCVLRDSTTQFSQLRNQTCLVCPCTMLSYKCTLSHRLRWFNIDRCPTWILHKQLKGIGSL